MGKSYFDLLVELGFDKTQLDLFIKEQQQLKTKFDKIGKFNSKAMGNKIQPISFSAKELYGHVKAFTSATPEKPLTKQQSSKIMSDIKEEQGWRTKVIEEEGISEELLSLIHEAVNLHNTFCDFQIDFNTAEFKIIANYSDNYDLAVAKLNEIIEEMLRYQDMDALTEDRLVYFKGLWWAIEELRMMVS